MNTLYKGDKGNNNNNDNNNVIVLVQIKIMSSILTQGKNLLQNFYRISGLTLRESLSTRALHEPYPRVNDYRIVQLFNLVVTVEVMSLRKQRSLPADRC